MTATLRTTLTLVGLAVLLVVGAMWGYAQITKPLPEAVEVPACTDVEIPAGAKVFPDQVVVHVMNAGNRGGLAGRTMGLLVGKGFVRGKSGNAAAGTEVEVAQVWTADPTGPSARLVASWLGVKPTKQPSAMLQPGVTVVVGDGFDGLKKGRKRIKVKEATTICAPPDSV